MEHVSHDGRRTAYRVADRGGDGGAVCCVHGSGGDHAVWRAQLGRLSRERPVVALDLSGHGASDDVDTPPGPATLAAYAEDLVAVAEATGVRALCGNSLGGAVVLTAVLDHGVDADALLLCGTGAKLAVLPDLLGWLRSDFDRAVAFLHGPDRLFHEPDGRYVEATTEALRETGPAVTLRDYASCDAFDVRDRLDEVAPSTLALTGEHDRLTPPWYHEYLADNVRDGEWTTIPEAAHLSMLERPDAFNAAVSGFLDG